MSSSDSPISFKYEHAEVLSFLDRSGTLFRAGGHLEFNFGFGLGFDTSEQRLSVRVDVRASLGSGKQETEELSGEKAASVDSTLAPDSLNAEDMEKALVTELSALNVFRLSHDTPLELVPRAVLAHLVGMSISCARGFLIAMGRSRHLQSTPIPVMTPLHFIDALAEDVQEQGGDWIDPTPIGKVSGSDA